MPKSSATGRVVGYHYAMINGRKQRVYGRNTATIAKKFVSKKTYKKPQTTKTAYTAVKSYNKTASRGVAPSVRTTGKSTTIAHTEFVQDITSSTAFINVQPPDEKGSGFSINIGNPNLFPWGCGFARLYEEWIPKVIKIHFKTTSTDLAGSAAAPGIGSVIMATDYNVYNPPFGSKAQMENYEGHVACKPSVNMTHTIDCSKLSQPVLYTRTSNQNVGGDGRLYDIGVFQIATVGMQSVGFAIGEMRIEYVVELRKPRMEMGTPSANGPAADHFEFFDTNPGMVPNRPFGTSTGALFFPTSESNLGGFVSGGIVDAENQPRGGIIPILDANGNATGDVGPSEADTYYFPQGVSSGVFCVNYVAQWTSTGAPAAFAYQLRNCESVNLMKENSIAAFGNQATTTTTTNAILFVRIVKNDANITFVGTAGASGPVFADLFVSELPTSIN